MLAIEEHGGIVLRQGFVSQTIYKMILGEFPGLSRSGGDMHVDKALYDETLMRMSEAGQLTVAFKPTSRLMLVQNFRTHNREAGYHIAGHFASNGDDYQRQHAAAYFRNYRKQVRIDMDREALRAANERLSQRGVVRTSSTEMSVEVA